MIILKTEIIGESLIYIQYVLHFSSDYAVMRTTLEEYTTRDVFVEDLHN